MSHELKIDFLFEEYEIEKGISTSLCTKLLFSVRESKVLWLKSHRELC